MDLLNLVEEACPKFEEGTNYWLVRTDGGKLYETFKEYDLIAIGYSKITVKEIEKTISNSSDNISQLTNLVISKFEDYKRPGFIVSQISRFFNEIKKDDYVVIPDLSTEKLCIGRVKSGQVIEKKLFKKERENKLTEIEGYTKTKKVKWVKEIPKEFINPTLYKLFFSHQTIVNANDYGYLINSMLNDFYFADNKYHLVLDVSKQNISAYNLFNSYQQLLSIADQFAHINNIDESIKDIQLSINLNSPGKIILYGKKALILFSIGAFIVGLNGGGFKLRIDDIKLDLDLSSPGFIKSYNEYLNSDVDRRLKEVLIGQLDTLNIKNPDDIVKILAEINKKNQNE